MAWTIFSNCLIAIMGSYQNSMETKLQYIREQVIKANPSIKELTFGCKFFIGKYPAIVVNTPEWKWVDFMVSFSADLVPKYDRFLRENFKDGEEEIKIIGREIRLADVINALPFEGREWWGQMSSVVEYWNLKQDNLELQSEETILFLYNLLK